MQAVLGEQNMGEQLRARTPACDRMRGRRWLRDRLAGPAGELLAHMLDHLPLLWDKLQRLGHSSPIMRKVEPPRSMSKPQAADRRCARAAGVPARAGGPAC